MKTVPSSEDCRLKAEAMERMAQTVSYKPDRERFAAEALIWRGKQNAVLALEAKPSS